jgi:hypothetical protein
MGTMSGKPIDVGNRLNVLDDFFMDEVLGSDHLEVDGETALAVVLADLERAELLLRKTRLREIRSQIDTERATVQVMPFNPIRMRERLAAAANDPDVRMTLAARNAIADGGDDLDSLLEDIAELERDAGADPTA